MNRNTLTLVGLVILITFMLTLGRYLSRRGTPGYTTGSGLAADPRGVEAPDFELKTLDGKTMKLSDLRGKAVLLNFWATWCTPCKVEMPWFEDLNKQYASQGLVVVGVAMDDASADEIGRFARDMKVTYPILLGTEAVGQAYGGVNVLPTTYYVGRDGKIVEKVPGLVGHKDIEEYIQKALATSAPPAAVPAATTTTPAAPVGAKP